MFQIHCHLRTYFYKKYIIFRIKYCFFQNLVCSTIKFHFASFTIKYFFKEVHAAISRIYVLFGFQPRELEEAAASCLSNGEISSFIHALILLTLVCYSSIIHPT